MEVGNERVFRKNVMCVGSFSQKGAIYGNPATVKSDAE